MNVSVTKPSRELKVLALGLPRTGSASLAEALTILGYKDVYHGLRLLDSATSATDLKLLNSAADATFPALNTYTGKDFTLQDWEKIFGSCEASTDVAGLFGPQLIKMYPKAKVILPIRNFDAWSRSVDEAIFEQLWSFWAEVCYQYVDPLFGSEFVTVTRKLVLGFFDAKTVEEARQNSRAVYDRHHRLLRERVPPEQLLVYTMGDGWAPLCEFLGEPVPGVQFPWVNERTELREKIAKRVRLELLRAVKVFAPWVVGAVILVLGLWLRKCGLLDRL